MSRSERQHVVHVRLELTDVALDEILRDARGDETRGHVVELLAQEAQKMRLRNENDAVDLPFDASGTELSREIPGKDLCGVFVG